MASWRSTWHRRRLRREAKKSAARHCALAPCGRGQLRWRTRAPWGEGLPPRAQSRAITRGANSSPDCSCICRAYMPSPTRGEGTIIRSRLSVAFSPEQISFSHLRSERNSLRLIDQRKQTRRWSRLRERGCAYFCVTLDSFSQAHHLRYHTSAVCSRGIGDEHETSGIPAAVGRRCCSLVVATRQRTKRAEGNPDRHAEGRVLSGGASAPHAGKCLPERRHRDQMGRFPVWPAAARSHQCRQ